MYLGYIEKDLTYYPVEEQLHPLKHTKALQETGCRTKLHRFCQVVQSPSFKH